MGNDDTPDAIGPARVKTWLAILWNDGRVKLIVVLLAIVIPMALLMNYLPPYHRVFYIHHDGQLLRCWRQGRRPVCRAVPEPPPRPTHRPARIHGG
jgi:hypothetical protein